MFGPLSQLFERKKRTALFIIDIQKALASDPQTQIPHAKRVKMATAEILAATYRFVYDAPEDSYNKIVYVQHEETPDRGPLQKGTPGWELVFKPTKSDLLNCREMLVFKNTRDAFESRLFGLNHSGNVFEPRLSDMTLAESLKASGIHEIIAVGIQSECCVLSTCLGAHAAGFKVSLVKRAHSTYDHANKTALEIEKEVEEQIIRKGGRVLDFDGVLRYWKQKQMEGGMSVEGYVEV
ncbi:Isochorismatase-like protein [Naviculisporaceae sp. PSN 640]